MQFKFSLTKLYGITFLLFLIWFWFLQPEKTNVPLSNKLFYSASLLMGFPIVWWLDTIRIIGFGSFAIIPTMAKVFFYSKRGNRFFLVLGLCTLFWWSPYNETKSPFVIEMTIIAYTSFLLLWFQPPGVLFLANANEKAGVVLGEISKKKFPIRTISMLNSKKIKLKRSSTTFSFLTDDCSIESEYEWETLVNKISSKVALIIIDARTSSYSLTKETKRILCSNDGRINRTVCISDKFGNVPALANLTLDEVNKFNIIPINELSLFLSRN